jgi:hypothetical protein
MACIACWLLLQIALPVRHVFAEGNPDWTGTGTRFAWRGQRCDKQAQLTLYVIQPDFELRWMLEPTGDFPVPLAMLYSPAELERKRFTEGSLRDLVQSTPETLSMRLSSLEIDPEEANRVMRAYEQTLKLHLAPQQFAEMARRPDQIWQYAQRVRQVLRPLLSAPVQVEARQEVSLNHRPWGLCLSDEIDLTTIDSALDLGPRLLPLREPLPDRDTRLAFAREREAELQRERDIALPTAGAKRPAEPHKVPAFTAEDEQWLRERFPQAGS